MVCALALIKFSPTPYSRSDVHGGASFVIVPTRTERGHSRLDLRTTSERRRPDDCASRGVAEPGPWCVVMSRMRETVAASSFFPRFALTARAAAPSTDWLWSPRQPESAEQLKIFAHRRTMRDLRFSVRLSSPAPMVSASGGALAGAGHRRQHRHLFDRQRSFRCASCRLWSRSAWHCSRRVSAAAVQTGRHSSKFDSIVSSSTARSRVPTVRHRRSSAWACGNLSADRQFALPATSAASLGIHAFRGRLLTPADDDASAPSGPVPLVVSYRLWQQRLGGREDVPGARLIINRVPVTIVGVMCHTDVRRLGSGARARSRDAQPPGGRVHEHAVRRRLGVAQHHGPAEAWPVHDERQRGSSGRPTADSCGRDADEVDQRATFCRSR